MELDLNQVAQTFEPWDFTLKIDGKKYRTRPFTLADARAAQTLAKKGNAEVKKFISGLFEEPPADLAQWDQDRVALVLAAVEANRMRMLRKNAETVALAVCPTRPAEKIEA